VKKNSLRHIKFKENPFKIPKGYFDAVENDVFAKISSENFPKKEGFSSPTRYFKDVENKILTKISEEENAEKSGFAIPENYLETIEDKVIAKISNDKRPVKVIDFKSIILNRVLPFAVAASLLLIISIIYNNKTTSFDSIASTDIERWIEDDLVTLDTYEIAEVYKDTQIENQDIFAEDELEEYLNGTDVESLLYEN